jgi:hypothetical protein
MYWNLRTSKILKTRSGYCPILEYLAVFGTLNDLVPGILAHFLLIVMQEVQDVAIGMPETGALQTLNSVGSCSVGLVTIQKPWMF